MNRKEVLSRSSGPMNDSSITVFSGSTSVSSEKIFARTATVRVDQVCNAFLDDCFRQYGIQVIPLPDDDVSLLQRQKFEACLVRLYEPDAEMILQAVRNSPSNCHAVIYGIARNAEEAMRHAAYGINAFFTEPLDHSAVMKVLRYTHGMVMNEFRRYFRIPWFSTCDLETQRGNASVTTIDVSSGGVRVLAPKKLAGDGAARLTLSLDHTSSVVVRASFCWKGEGADAIYGLRFDPADLQRATIKAWIDRYLSGSVSEAA